MDRTITYSLVVLGVSFEVCGRETSELGLMTMTLSAVSLDRRLDSQGLGAKGTPLKCLVMSAMVHSFIRRRC